MDIKEIVRVIDHTNIWPKASFEDIRKLCTEARRYGFGCVCVNPFYIKYAVSLLRRTGINVGATCGFPFGANTTYIKMHEAGRAIDDGAREIDMVINIGALRSKQYAIVENDIKGVVKICRKNKVVSKVILEMNLLNEKEKEMACRIAKRAGADFLKTGTGLWGRAKIKDVRLMKKIAGDRIGVKAAGGIRTIKQVQGFIKAGAARIGTSSGVGIVKDYLKHEREYRD